MEKRETTVSIAELAQQERAESETAYQEIAGQLSQISESSQSTVQNPSTQNLSSNEAPIRVVQTIKIPRETKAARRQEMLRRFEKAAA